MTGYAVSDSTSTAQLVQLRISTPLLRRHVEICEPAVRAGTRALPSNGMPISQPGNRDEISSRRTRRDATCRHSLSAVISCRRVDPDTCPASLLSHVQLAELHSIGARESNAVGPPAGNLDIRDLEIGVRPIRQFREREGLLILLKRGRSEYSVTSASPSSRCRLRSVAGCARVGTR